LAPRSLHPFPTRRSSDLEAMSAFSNPLLLPEMRPQLEATFSQYENGHRVLDTLYARVGTALLGGIQWIFLISAVLMIGLFFLNLDRKITRLNSSHGSISY